MNLEQRAIHNTRRGKQASDVADHIATTRTGAVVTKTESQRMAEWLRRKQPNFSAFGRRAH